MEISYILEISHLTKVMPKSKAVVLNDVSFRVARGAIHGLLGENGSGRTTLMKILAGLYPAKAYEGQLMFDGQLLALGTPADALRHGISLVPGKLAVFDHLSVAENVMMASWQMDHQFLIRRRESEAQAQEVLDSWGLDIDPSIPAARLTAIQKRQVMIARALCTGPRLVILDEPLYSMTNVHAVSQVLRMIRRLAEREVTCMYLSRRPADAFQIADQVTVLRDGVVAGNWERVAFDEGAVAAAMMSRRSGELGDVEQEEAEDSGGLFGPLRAYFDQLWRPRD